MKVELANLEADLETDLETESAGKPRGAANARADLADDFSSIAVEIGVPFFLRVESDRENAFVRVRIVDHEGIQAGLQSPAPFAADPKALFAEVFVELRSLPGLESRCGFDNRAGLDALSELGVRLSLVLPGEIAFDDKYARLKALVLRQILANGH